MSANPKVKLAIVIPTINRKELLREAMERLLPQNEYFQKILIVDNGKQDLSFPSAQVEIYLPPQNLGVAASWNHGIHQLFADPTVTHVMALNDDVALGQDQLIDVINVLQEMPSKWMFKGRFQWSVWILSRAGAEAMQYESGKYFDDRFFPAYFEDNDFHWRLRAFGEHRYIGDLIELTPEVQRSSMTVQKDPALNTRFPANRRYYVEKWGGPPGQEMRHPDHGFEAEYLYARSLREAHDIKEHLPIIRGYAELCEHVTEFGAFAAATTWALLSAKPNELHCYDLQGHGMQVVVAAGKHAGCEMIFNLQDVLKCEIVPTDLLLIDTVGNYFQLSEELRLHANKVRKYIIIHDTVAYGYHDEMPNDTQMISRRGLCTAILDFMEYTEEGKLWEITETLRNNNGLTILGRISDASAPTVKAKRKTIAKTK